MKFIKSKLTKLAISCIALVAMAGVTTSTVSAATYGQYYKVDNYASKPRTVKLTKNIIIRKVVWAKNNVKHHLGSSKTLRKGTTVKVLANNPKYCWSLFGKYANWVYPHKTTNWFKTSKVDNRNKLDKQIDSSYYDTYFKDNVLYIKNKGELKLESAKVDNNSIVLDCTFKNTSGNAVDVAPLISEYLKVTVTGSDVSVMFTAENDYTVKPHSTESVVITSQAVSHPEVLQQDNRLTFVQTKPASNTKKFYLPYK